MNQILAAEDILPHLNKPLPFSDEAERGFLSCLVQDPKSISVARVMLPPEAYYVEVNRIIYEEFINLYDGKGKLDPILLTQALRQNGTLEKVGGPVAISEMFTFAAIPAHFTYYHDIIKDCYTARRNIHAYARAIQALITEKRDKPLNVIMEDIKEILADANNEPGHLLKSRSLAQILPEVFDEIEYRAKNPGKLAGWTTGIPELDKLTSGQQKGRVTIVAGAPSDGKSTLMQNMAESAAHEGAKIRWYPLEMPDTEQAFRLLSSDSQVDNKMLYTGLLSRESMDKLQQSMKRLCRLGVQIVNVDDATASDIFTDIERSECDIAVVDYLQLMEEPAGKNTNREQVISNMSRRMKRLARQKKIHIISGSQLNDSGQLRESRSIGQDADTVLMLRKVEDAKSESGFDDGRRDLFCNKMRGGKRHWTLPLNFQGSTFTFRATPQ